MLEALEEENFKILPQKAYIRGFVKSFVKTVGGNQKKAIKVLEQTHRHYFPEEYITSEEEEEILQNSELPSGNIVKITLTVASILAVLAIGFFLLSSSDKKRSKETTETETPSESKKDSQEDSPKDFKTNSESTKSEPDDVSPTRVSSKTPLKTAPPESNNEQETTEKDVPQKETDSQKEEKEKEEQETENEEEGKITLRPFPANLYEYADVDHQKQVEKHIPQQMQTVIPNKENLFIRATEGKTWLAYKADDKPVKTFTLEEGEYTMIRANTIRIFFGNIRAAKIFLNNKHITTVSRTGVKSLVFPEEKKDQFKLPLFIFKDSGQVITSEEYEKQQAKSN